MLSWLESYGSPLSDSEKKKKKVAPGKTRPKAADFLVKVNMTNIGGENDKDHVAEIQSVSFAFDVYLPLFLAVILVTIGNTLVYFAFLQD